MKININDYIKLVHHIAHKYRWAGATHEDLVSAGIEGLVEAKDRFDPEMGNKYITYAHWWVRAYIQKAVNSHIKNNHKSLNQNQNSEARTQTFPDSDAGKQTNLIKMKIIHLRCLF